MKITEKKIAEIEKRKSNLSEMRVNNYREREERETKSVGSWRRVDLVLYRQRENEIDFNFSDQRP